MVIYIITSFSSFEKQCGNHSNDSIHNAKLKSMCREVKIVLNRIPKEVFEQKMAEVRQTDVEHAAKKKVCSQCQTVFFQIL